MLSQLEHNLSRVRSKIGEACERAGRDPDSVRLLPVTKYVSEVEIRGLMELGLTEFAESRAQDLRRKAAALPGADWVMIGHLQTNKVGQVVGLVTQVQSVDSMRIARALSGRAVRDGADLEVLIQVNTSGEESKYGFQAGEVEQAIREIGALPGLNLTGFMTMATNDPDPKVARLSFQALREIRDEHAPWLSELSMGMSGDFETAIEEGATIVRVGSSLFQGLL